MPKNTHIHVKVSSEDIKTSLNKKAKAYGGSLSDFLEYIAKHDIVVLDENASKIIRTLTKNERR